MLEQARRLSEADGLAAVTGQAMGLGIFLPRGAVLLEALKNAGFSQVFGWFRPVFEAFPMRFDLFRCSFEPQFSPSTLGSYGCRWGWDMNAHTEVGQIGRLASLHHHCLRCRALGVAPGGPEAARRTAHRALAQRGAADALRRAEAGFTWRMARHVRLPLVGRAILGAKLLKAVEWRSWR